MSYGKFNCTIKPDEDLAKILGTSDALYPSEMIKRLWAYIKTHDLKKNDNPKVEGAVVNA